MAYNVGGGRSAATEATTEVVDLQPSCEARPQVNLQPFSASSGMVLQSGREEEESLWEKKKTVLLCRSEREKLVARMCCSRLLCGSQGENKGFEGFFEFECSLDFLIFNVCLESHICVNTKG